MSDAMTTLESRVRAYILGNLMFSSNDADLANDASLLERGIIDSTGVMEVILFLEEEFGIKVRTEDMLPDNFDSVDNIVRFVRRMRDTP